jgi:sentrin-specific protease 1
MAKKGERLDLSDWIDKSWALGEIPHQTNGWDCGVFMCQFAAATARNVSINFSPADMPYMR